MSRVLDGRCASDPKRDKVVSAYICIYCSVVRIYTIPCSQLGFIRMARSTTVSSPGKVLAAGGYLVLDPAYSGVVISTSSRFYTVIRDHAYGSNAIRVRSPQFKDASWGYDAKFDPSVAVDAASAK
jgi:hypothetical protein